MDNITILEGNALHQFLAAFGIPRIQKDLIIHTVRLNQREDGIAFKINSGTWSPTIGRRADSGGY